MNVNYAKIFIKEYEIKKLDTRTLEIVISKLGHNLIVYNPLFDYDDNIAAIIEGFNIDNELKNTCCFTCKSELVNCIFVRDGIEENELIHLLLHEICHIYMHHVDKNVIANSSYYEHEANKFADDVKRFVNLNCKQRKVLCSVPILLVLALTIGVIALNFKSNQINEALYYQQNQVPLNTTPEAITETTTEPIITEPTVTSITEKPTEQVTENNVEKLYYVSKSGKKYHLEDCNYINADECTKLTLEEVEKLEYEPCKVCKPNKYS